MPLPGSDFGNHGGSAQLRNCARGSNGRADRERLGKAPAESPTPTLRPGGQYWWGGFVTCRQQAGYKAAPPFCATPARRFHVAEEASVSEASSRTFCLILVLPSYILHKTGVDSPPRHNVCFVLLPVGGAVDVAPSRPCARSRTLLPYPSPRAVVGGTPITAP